jgi:hypothetical protein
MTAKRKVEVFSAGCPACVETIELVNRVACPSCEVSFLDMSQAAVAQPAKELGIRSVPAVLIDDKLADCCAGRIYFLWRSRQLKAELRSETGSAQRAIA